MGTAINIADQNLVYRVNHPEFDPTMAYKAIAFIDYGESAWSKLLFINERGMTYSVKVKRCLCLNPFIHGRVGRLLDVPCNTVHLPVAMGICDQEILDLPWPKPRVVNPDLEED